MRFFLVPRIFYRIACVALLCALLLCAGQIAKAHAQTEEKEEKNEKYTVGYTEIAPSGDKPDDTPPVLVWYPSTDAPNLESLGPYEVSWAQDGAVADGRYPLVIFSHGVNGRARRHRDTGAALAAAGVIMVAPWHRHDRRIANDVTRVEVRMRELAEALEAVAQHPTLREAADFSRLGGLGFSFGAVPTLGIHGVTLDLKTAQAHCKKHKDEDPRFCNYGNIIVRTLRRWNSGREVQVPSLLAPIESLVLVFPVAQAYRYEDFARQETPLLLVRGGADGVLPYPFHAESIHEAWAGVHTYTIFPDAHHNAFVSPVPAWYAEEEDVGGAADDPEGFNRPAFLQAINHVIAEHFKRTLPPSAEE